jgi:hypothetical protein
MSSFWKEFIRTFIAITIRPQSAFARLADDRDALTKALLTLAIIIGIYTAILGIFISHGYTAVAASALSLPLEQQYPVQIWYQGPLFLFATLATAGLLVVLSRWLGGSTDYVVAFARITYASTIPFYWTTMLVELVTALGFLCGFFHPVLTRTWLLGDGSGFAAAYQLIGVIWIVVLFIITARETTQRNWFISTVVGIASVIFYALPIGFFIR